MDIVPDEITFEHPGDRLRLRRALGCFPTGVAIATTRDPDGAAWGLTINSFASVSLDPPLVLWSLGLHQPSHKVFLAARHFAVSVLAVEQADISRRFASRAHDKFAGLATQEGAGACPLIPDALATFECEAASSTQQGDHSVFFGRVLRARYRPGEPLIFSNGIYSARPVSLAC
jgi:flavin reductase (DIM6/NTAB) family NADH-FMN oxidoreductase RutF